MLKEVYVIFPLKMLRRVSEVLGVPKEDLKKAILDDHGKDFGKLPRHRRNLNRTG